MRRGKTMLFSDDLPNLLENAIQAFADRDFATADNAFELISQKNPNNWTARYFHALTLCATGDFSDARNQLSHISKQSSEPMWRQVARSGLTMIDIREQRTRQSLNELLKV